MQLFSYVTGGGFTTSHEDNDTKILISSDPMTWTLTAGTSAGTWRFTSRYKNSNTPAGYTITDHGALGYLKISDAYEISNAYFGTQNNTVALGGDNGLTLSVYDTSGNKLTALTPTTSAILATSDGNYMLKLSGSTLSLVAYDTSDTYGCLWTIETSGSMARIRIGTNYLRLSGRLVTVSSASTYDWCMLSGTLIMQPVFSLRYGSSSQVVGTTDTQAYTSTLYRYSATSGSSITLTPANNVTTGTFVIILYDGSNYYFVQRSGNQTVIPVLKTSAITANADGTLTYNGNSGGEIAASYRFTLSVSGGLYRLANTSRSTTYLSFNASNSTVTLTTTSAYIWRIDDGRVLYTASDTLVSNTPSLAAPSMFSATAQASGGTFYFYIKSGDTYLPLTERPQKDATLAMVTYRNGEYYLVGLTKEGTNLRMKPLGITLPASLSEGQVSDSYRISAKEAGRGVQRILPLGGMYRTSPEQTALFSGRSAQPFGIFPCFK